jgi:hypothetical protein
MTGLDPRHEDPLGKANFRRASSSHNGKEYRFPALPVEVLAILNDGGLMPHVKKALART